MNARSSRAPLDAARRLDFEAARYVGDDDRDRRLARLVAAGDTDIRVHLERVNRRIAAGDADGAYGALVDLFIATEPGNVGIRARATFWATDLLDEERLIALQSAVAEGLDPATPMPFALHAVRSLGVTGRPQLVARRAAAPAGGGTPARRAAGPADPAPPWPLDAARPGPTTAAPEATAPSAIERFDPNDHLVGLLAQVARSSSTSIHEVRGPFGSLLTTPDLVQPEVHADLAPWVTAPLPSGAVELVPAPSRRLDPARAWPLDEVLWNLTVLTSAGRVPVDLPEDRPLALRRWPNLTRVTRLPGDTRLASILHGTGATIDALLARAPDRVAAASFVAAAWVTGILVVRAGDEATPEPPRSRSAAPLLRDLVGALRRWRR